jgi:hypothetical protein
VCGTLEEAEQCVRFFEGGSKYERVEVEGGEGRTGG